MPIADPNYVQAAEACSERGHKDMPPTFWDRAAIALNSLPLSVEIAVIWLMSVFIVVGIPLGAILAFCLR